MESQRAHYLSEINRYHRTNLSDVLAFYGGITVAPETTQDVQTTAFVTGPTGQNTQIHSIKLTALDLHEMTITFRHPALDVDMERPIKLQCPPGLEKCQNHEDVKECLIYMFQKSAESRGFSEIVLRGVAYPTSVFNIVLIGLVFMLLYGHYQSDKLYSFFESLPGVLSWLAVLKPFHDYIMYGTFVIHVVEIYYFLLPCLRKYRISTDYAIEWYLLALLDGYPTIKRLEDRVSKIKLTGKYWKF